MLIFRVVELELSKLIRNGRFRSILVSDWSVGRRLVADWLIVGGVDDFDCDGGDRFILHPSFSD